MKKLFAAFAVILVFLLTSCGQTATSKSMTDSLSGTYVGKNGSVLTLFPDGTSEYYYMTYSSGYIDRRAGKWDYNDGKLTWYYNDTPITATIDEKHTMSFTLDQTDGWNREQYLKASDTAESKSAEECQQLMKSVLKRPDMDNFDNDLNQSYRLGGMVVKIPFYWNLTDKGSYTFFFTAEDFDTDSAILLIDYATTWDMSNEAFEENAVECWQVAVAATDDEVSQSTTVQEPTKIYKNGIPGVQGIVRKENEDYAYNQTTTLLCDENSGTAVMIQLYSTDNTIFKYDSDYAKIIDSVKVVQENTQSPKKRSSDNAKQSETTKPTAKGVTPELKEFLDHYETFIDKYIAFMKKYETSDDTYGMLSDYLDILQEYSDFAEQLDQYDTDKMSAADSAYYLEVTTRVAKKLYAVAIQ